MYVKLYEKVPFGIDKQRRFRLAFASAQCDRTFPVVKNFNAVELQGLEQAWDHDNWFQSKVVPASQGNVQYL